MCLQEQLVHSIPDPDSYIGPCFGCGQWGHLVESCPVKMPKAGYFFRQPVVGRAEECGPEESGYALCDANTTECKSLYSYGLESSMGMSEGVNEIPEHDAECCIGDKGQWRIQGAGGWCPPLA